MGAAAGGGCGVRGAMLAPLPEEEGEAEEGGLLATMAAVCWMESEKRLRRLVPELALR